MRTIRKIKKETDMSKQKEVTNFIAPEELVLVVDKSHHLYDERAEQKADPELLASIVHHGIITPIIVAKVGETLEVIDGRRRVIAAKQLNMALAQQNKPLIKVPYVVRESDNVTLAGIMVTTNEIREDDGVLAKAKKAEQLRNMGMNTKDIAVQFGTTVQSIDTWLKVSKLSNAVRYQIEMGSISPTAAVQWADMPHEEQDRMLDEALNGGVKITTATARHAAETGRVEKALKYRPIKEVTAIYENIDEHIEQFEDKAFAAGYKEAILWVLRKDEATVQAMTEKEEKKNNKEEAQKAREEARAKREEAKALRLEAKRLAAEAKAAQKQRKAAKTFASTEAPVQADVQGV